MTTVGPSNPTASASNNASGYASWTNPTNVYALDASYASYASDDVSEYLDVTGFGFSIPSGSTINGIQFDVSRRRSNSSASIKDLLVNAMKAGTAVGSNYADTSTNWPTSFTYKTYGGAADLWGTTWTYSDINNSGFGLRFQGDADSNVTSSAGRVDHVRCTITYTAGVAGSLFTVSACAGIGCTGPKNFARGNE